jgi:putative addiction module component (TIGR02574 family)
MRSKSSSRARKLAAPNKALQQTSAASFSVDASRPAHGFLRRPSKDGLGATRAPDACYWKLFSALAVEHRVVSRTTDGRPRGLELARRVARVVLRSYAAHVAQPVQIPPPGFDELTPDEKLRYVAALWDRIVAEQDSLPISDAQRALIRERLAAHRANPDAARPWSEARRDIEALLRRPR